MVDVQLSSTSRKFLRKTDAVTWKRVIARIGQLKGDPFPSDAKRVVGRKDKTFRVRVGEYRILYVVFFKKNLLLIAKIDKRQKVY